MLGQNQKTGGNDKLITRRRKGPEGLRHAASHPVLRLCFAHLLLPVSNRVDRRSPSADADEFFAGTGDDFSADVDPLLKMQADQEVANEPRKLLPRRSGVHGPVNAWQQYRHSVGI